MKKIAKFLITAFLVLTVFLGTACTPHVHDFFTKWSADEKYHWHDATCGIKSHHSAKGEHSWDNGKQSKPATEYEEGEMLFTCTVCGMESKKPIEKLPHEHKYLSTWSTDEKYHWHGSACNHADFISDKAEHKYTYRIQTSPTEESSGLALGECSECKKSSNAFLPVLSESNGYTYTEENGKGVWTITINDYELKIGGHEQYSWYPTITEVMPAIHINTSDGSNTWATKYNRNSKLNGQIEYVAATVSTAACEESEKLTDISAQVKVRGNYTLQYEKKPIRIKFDKKQNLLGLHEGEKYKNWVLLANWKDLSMTNNSIAYYLGQTILGSDGYYCTDFRYVEVYLNGQYWGVYLLCEQQEVKDGRTSVPEVEDNYQGTDIGYFFEYDGYYDTEINMPNGQGDPTFVMDYSGGSGAVRGYTIKSDIYNDAQINFLRNYMNNAYKIAIQATRYNKFYEFNSTYTGIVDATGKYSSAKDVVAACIDIQSLVDAYILNEIACDLDVAWSSFYLSVDLTASGNKKVTFEAPWDFDSCFGMVNNCCTSGIGMYAANKNNPWYNLVTNQAWFKDMVKQKWVELKNYGVFETSLELVNDYKTTYESYFKRNYERWPNRLNGNSECVAVLNSYRTQGQAADYLYNWLTTRYNYLDTQWNFPVVEEEEDDWTNEGKTAYRYEAENAETTGGIALRTGNNASGDGYLGQVSGAAGKTITVTVNSSTATEAYLYVGLSLRNYETTFSNWFSVSVNGTAVGIPTRVVPMGSGDGWHDWYGVKVVKISLKAGQNKVTLTTASGDTTNVDYIELFCATKLT
ncbi:MAG: CotH kinase family protein [Clostridia bacterium]|nr:CotH kinase family protein [Clostridia bacterium]